MANDPGWYPDPWRPGRRRWWDGGQWTDDTWDPDAAPQVEAAAASSAPAVPLMWLPIAPNDLAYRELHAERGAARLAKLGFAVIAATTIINQIVFALTFPDYVDRFTESIDKGTSMELSGVQAATQPIGIFSIAAFITVAVWAHRAATVARNLHYPAARSTGWAAAAWFVPPVNFWFPYQSVRDMLPPGHGVRSLVGRWWALYLLSSFGVAAVMVASYTSAALALAVALPLGIAGVVAALTARDIVDAIEADHAAAIAELRG